MKRVYAHQNGLMMDHLKNILESHGIDCVTRNKDLAIAVGELPPIECWPELWIVDDERYEEAQKIVKKTMLFTGPTSRPWTCPQCGESIEGQFTDCWNCAATQPEKPA